MTYKLFSPNMPTTLMILVLASLCFVPMTAIAQTQVVHKPAPQSLKGFATPQEAADDLIKVAAAFDVAEFRAIFGPDGEDLISSADPVRDKNNAAAFAQEAAEAHTVKVDPSNPKRATLIVGHEQWPLPVPIVQRSGKWYFDAATGRKEILRRRIGANELDAIQVCRGFVEAQKEYATQIHDNSGVNQYAQRILSTPGKQDGLYWTNADGSPAGPIGEAVAKALNEGYSVGNPGYHGYYFKILKGQGPAAPLGRLNYVIEGVMIGGFALVAVPAEYNVTGIKTFIVSNNGIVYQKDLGSNSLDIVKTMDVYNPDSSWHRTNDEWPPDVTLADDSSN
jgi:Protein of unknown function (DUF2950)